MQEYQNTYLSPGYFSAIKLIKEYRSQENLPDFLKTWMDKLISMSKNSVMGHNIALPAETIDWVKEESIKFKHPVKVITLPEIERYSLLYELCLILFKQPNFDIWDFPVYDIDSQKRIEYINPLSFYVFDKGMILPFIQSFKNHDWIETDKNGVEFVFHYLHRCKILPVDHKFKSWHFKDPIGNTVMHYAALYGCLPDDLPEEFLTMENKDGVTVKQMRTIRLAINLNKSSGYAKDMYEQ